MHVATTSKVTDSTRFEVEAATKPARSRVIDWQTASATKFREIDPKRTVVLVTCAPIEVHGPHLPMFADIREAEGLLDAIVDELLARDPDICFLRLPPYCMGTDVVPQRGSLPFSAETIVRVLEELGTTLARQGFVHIWVANFHGGPRHVLALEKASAKVNRRHGVRMLSIFSLLANQITGGSAELADRLGGIGGVSREELVGDQHGGLIETAMLLHLAGDHVEKDYDQLPRRSLEIQMKELGRPPLQRGPRATMFELLRSLPDRLRYYETETYAGGPARASAALGRRYLEELAGDAARALLPMYRREADPSAGHTPLWKLRHVLMNEAFGWLFERAFATKRRAI